MKHTKNNKNTQLSAKIMNTIPTGCSGRCPSMTRGRNRYTNITNGNNISLSPLDSDTTTLSSSGSITPSLSPSGLTRESSRKTIFMPQAFRFAESGHISTLSPSGLTRGTRNEKSDLINKDTTPLDARLKAQA